MRQNQLTKNNKETEQPLQIIVKYSLENGTIINETYIYLYDKLIAKVDNNNKKFFYHPDHLGSTTLVTNELGEVVENISYYPFGEVLVGDNKERFLYTGQEWDRESELLYYGARYYDPELARFLQADSIKPDIYNPQSLNGYSYTLNNPYTYTDPDGKSPHLAVAVGAGLIVGAIQGGITYYQTGDVNKALLSGSISALATTASVATFGAASTVVVAGGSALRYAGASAGTQVALAGIGAAESVAQQTLVQGTSLSGLSYSDIAISATGNAFSSQIFEKIGAPGIISRNPGQFFPSTSGSALLAETGSQTTQSLYGEGLESFIKKTINGEESYVNYYIPTTQTPIQEEGSGRKPLLGSSSSGSGGGSHGSNIPPPGLSSSSIGGCGVLMSCP